MEETTNNSKLSPIAQKVLASLTPVYEKALRVGHRLLGNQTFIKVQNKFAEGNAERQDIINMGVYTRSTKADLAAGKIAEMPEGGETVAKNFFRKIEKGWDEDETV